MKVFTIGFTRKSAETFFGLLRQSGAKRIVDVRLHTTSQLAGFAKEKDLAWFAKELCGMEYVHVPELAPNQEIFEYYKKNHGDWAVFRERFLALMKKRRIEETVNRALLEDGVLLCSEHAPEECHRSMVAEYLQEKWGDVEVVHLM